MREFIERLKEEAALEIIKKPVSPIFEAARIAHDKGPVLFENINNSKAVVNLLDSRQILAEALGIGQADLIKKLIRVEPYGRTEIIEYTWDVDATPDLSKLPIMKFFERDGGSYITAGVLVAKYGETSNAAIHRMMVIDKTSLAIRLVPPRHTYLMHKSKANRMESLDVAVAIGIDPVTLFASTTRVPCGREFNYAAALKGETQQLIPCENGVLVPPAELVLEGQISPTRTAEEGPFVDITGTYDLVRSEPVLELTRMVSVRDPIYHSIIPASSEHCLLMGIPYEPRIYKACHEVAKVKNVVLTAGGCHYLHAVIKIEKQTEGDAKNVIMAAFAAHTSLKHVVVVDDDIDIYNPTDVEFAIATRVKGDKDILIIPNVRGSSLDPRAETDGTTTKVGIDATAVLREHWKFQRARLS